MTKARKSGIGFILATIILFSCDDEPSGPKDFRDQYVGKYQVHESISSYGWPDMNGESYSRERDTVILVDYGNSDTTLIVLGREVWLDTTGSYYDYHYSLRMRDDSLWSFFMNGGLGGGQYEIYEGVRISPETD